MRAPVTAIVAAAAWAAHPGTSCLAPPCGRAACDFHGRATCQNLSRHAAPPAATHVVPLISLILTLCRAQSDAAKKGLHSCSSPTCTLSQNGYGDRSGLSPWRYARMFARMDIQHGTASLARLPLLCHSASTNTRGPLHHPAQFLDASLDCSLRAGPSAGALCLCCVVKTTCDRLHASRARRCGREHRRMTRTVFSAGHPQALCAVTTSAAGE